MPETGAVVKMRIDVTQDCIDYGNSKASSCPVALALNKAGFEHVIVLGEEIWFYHHPPMTLPCIVSQRIKMFDAGRGMHPFSFELDIESL